MKKMDWKNCFTIGTSAVLTMSLLVGCGASQPSGTQQSASEIGVAGTVLLSVNPEIEVEYDNGGLVLEINGINDDGKTVVAGFEDYKGKDCRTVVNELVKEIYESGYFNKTVDGHAKNIVLKMEEGSAYPDDDFLEEVAEGVRDAVKTCGITSETMTVREDDLDDKGRIGQDKAKELLLSQLGLNTASFNNHEYELDDDVYEFELAANGVEYEYEVDARTGKILEADIDGNNDWDDRDDWDGWEKFNNQNDDDEQDDSADDEDDQDDDDDQDDSAEQDDSADDDDDDGQDDSAEQDDDDDQDDSADDEDDQDDSAEQDDDDDQDDDDGQDDSAEQDDDDDQDDSAEQDDDDQDDAEQDDDDDQDDDDWDDADQNNDDAQVDSADQNNDDDQGEIANQDDDDDQDDDQDDSANQDDDDDQDADNDQGDDDRDDDDQDDDDED